jgi:hypothetical protein
VVTEAIPLKVPRPVVGADCRDFYWRAVVCSVGGNGVGTRSELPRGTAQPQGCCPVAPRATELGSSLQMPFAYFDMLGNRSSWRDASVNPRLIALSYHSRA